MDRKVNSEPKYYLGDQKITLEQKLKMHKNYSGTKINYAPKN